MDVGRFWLNMRRDAPVVEKPVEKVEEPETSSMTVEELVAAGDEMLKDVWVPAPEAEVAALPAQVLETTSKGLRLVPTTQEQQAAADDLRVRSHREMEAAKAAMYGAVRGKFIETEQGFLRLDVVQRFEVWEPYSGKWRVDAYVDQYLSVLIGFFKSEAEAREAVIRLLGGS